MNDPFNSIRLSMEIVDLPSGLSVVQTTHSWVKAMAQLYSAMGGNNDITVINDTSGSNFTFDNGNTNSSGLRADAALNDDLFGLQVGTSNTAITKNDNALNTKIADGGGASQLVYNIMVISAATAVAGGYRVTLSRQFDNNSGSTITVEECGVVTQCRDTGNAVKYALIVHDLQTQAITNGTSKIFKYNFDFLF